MNTKKRKIIQYALLVSTLLIQVFILLFFYNEFFNEKKLTEIRSQIEENNRIRSLNNASKHELYDAQKNLAAYLKTFEKENLDLYFIALRKVLNNLEQVKIFENSKNLHSKKNDPNWRNTEISRMEFLIDSIYKISPLKKTAKNPFYIGDINIEEPILAFEQEERIVIDSVKKKKLFSRVKDALKNKVDVKQDTVYVVTKVNNSIDTTRIRENLDSSVKSVNERYQKEVKKIQHNIQSFQKRNNQVVDVYTNLLELSNKLLEVYDLTYDDLSFELERQYEERAENINNIRRFTIFGLMILMCVVLVILAYFTRLTFSYQKELQMAAEKIQKNLNFKNRILGMLSHEIRSPLKILKIFINRIDRKNTDAEITESLNAIRFTTDSLLIQANQILEYTNDKNKTSLQSIAFNLFDEIEAILTIFLPYIQSVNNELIIVNELSKDLDVYTDKAKLHQLFINLLGNANKFTQQGKITIHLKCTEVSKYRIVLNVSISDTGTGISENDLKKVFEPYYKGTVSEDLENIGAGLGLNLCKEIVELFNGEIGIKSKLDEGTTVHFKIILGR
jgi:two-component system, NarL family, sensor histidine kinase BarA